MLEARLKSGCQSAVVQLRERRKGKGGRRRGRDSEGGNKMRVKSKLCTIYIKTEHMRLMDYKLLRLTMPGSLRVEYNKIQSVQCE